MLAATALVAALVGAAAGGLVAAITVAGEDNPSSSEASRSEPGNAPVELTESVAVIADRGLPSVVTIDVSVHSDGGTGSGVIIRSDGYILTNNHVVAQAADGEGRVAVSLYKQLHQFPATIVGRDPKTDLAVIKVDVPEQLRAAVLGRSGSLVVGAPVVAIGAPLGLSGTVTTGIVSALDRNPTVPGEDGRTSVLIGAIQIDAAINPGNSGGALLDGHGQVVGINTAIAAIPGTGDRSVQSGNIGVGFAIPIDYARSVAEEIISTGRATHPFIGVSAATITPEDAEDRRTSPGAFVRDVEPGGPADQAGIRPGDIITRVDSAEISGSNDLIAATRLHRIGDQVEVAFERDRRTSIVQVTLREQHD